jgi:3D (Asp-Asp-Asp) domain-containing protein
MTVEATAYCACKICTGKEPGHPAYGITASGERVRPGMVAVDPTVIPLGTRLWVEGYGEAEALDTGGAIKGKIIDVYFPSHQQALEWGRKQVTIRLE